MTRIDVVLIGAGRMGQVHGPNAARTPGLRLRYVVDPRLEVAGAMAAATGAEPATLEQALADPAVGGVLVCSSTDQHLDNALQAVAAGKAVFCEKPIDLDLGKVLAAQPRFEGARFLLGRYELLLGGGGFGGTIGYTDVHARLSRRLGSTHDAEHRMVEVLAETLWEAQRAGRAPDESAYLDRLRRL